MVPDSCASALFPSNESTTWHSLPSTGSSREQFPCFAGTMECSDLLRPSRRTSLPSCGPTRRCACRFAPDGPGHVTAGQGFSSGPHCRTLTPGDGQEFPGSWGIRVCLRPALRPRQDRLARPYDGVGAAPALTKTEAPTRMFSGLNHTALALAVYASSRALLHATQDSLPAVGHFTGRD